MTTFQDSTDTSVDVRSRTSGSPLLERASLLLGAGLIGFGVVVWIAGNWDGLGRYGRFALLTALLLSCLGAAIWKVRVRPAALLVAHFGIGGLLALIGQTYQTGADTWTLFAAWAAFSLPLALVVRGDSLWTAWTAVAMAGIALYVKNEGWTTSRGHVDILVALVAWATALTITLLMLPGGPIRRWIGRSTWAWRTGVLLSVLIVAPTAGFAVFQSTPDLLFGIGLLVLGAVFALTYYLRLFDVVAAAILALGIDALLIVATVRLAFEGKNLFGGILIVAIVALLSVGATTKVILARWRQTQEDDPNVERASRKSPPWAVVVFSGLGALLAVIPVTALVAYVLFTVAGIRVMDGPFPMLIGGAIALGGTKLLRTRTDGIFAIVLGLVLCVAGVVLVYFGSVRAVTSGGAYALAAVFLSLIALATPQAWLQSLFGALASVSVAMSMRYLTTWGMPGYSTGHLFLQIASHLVLLGVLFAYVSPPKAFLAARSFLAGWLAATIVLHALGSGSTFLSMAYVSMLSKMSLAAVPMLWWPFAMLVSTLGAGWLLWRREDLHRPIVVILCVLGIALTGFVPRLGVPMLVGAVAFAEGHRRLSVLAAISGAWVLGAFYYSLNYLLTTKGMILVAFGAVLAASALALGRLSDMRMRLDAGETALPSGRLDRPLIAIAGVALLALCGWSVAAKERVLRDGRTVMMRPAPVDPRSLVQGDYMTLALDLGPGLGNARPSSLGAPQPVAVGTVDGNGVVAVSTVRQGRPDRVEPGQIVIALTEKGGRHVVASDAWFFKEGTGGRFNQARYGILRVMPDGTAMLAGLADAERRRID